MAKRYNSVLAMVKDLSSPEFAKDFEKHLKKETVYVYFSASECEVEVFSTLRLAKKWAENRLDVKLPWQKVSNDTWVYGHSFISRKIIVRV